MIHINAPMQDDSQLWGRHWGYDLFKRSLKDGKAKCKSISVHSFEEYQEIYDYADQIFISPFFDSISKKGYTQNKALWNINENVKLDKAVALGGINASNCLELRKIGISRFAVLGAVWNNENPLSSFLEIQNMVK